MRSVTASLATLVLAACGSATGDLPDIRAPDVFADPTTVASADTASSMPVDGSPLPVLGADPAPVFGDPTVDAPVTDGPFAAPDPTATTLVARLGHVALRALAERLVTGGIVGTYLAVDDAVLALADSSDGGTRDCPAGGRVGVARAAPMRGTSLELVFDGCRIGDTTLSGALRRVTFVEGERTGSSETLDLDFRGLVVASDEERVSVTGTTRRTVARRANTECGGEDVDVLVAHAIADASVARDGIVERLVGARHESVRERVRTGSSESSSGCHERVVLSFEGRATAFAGRFGATRATLSRRGRIVRDARAEREPPASATLEVEVDDGSRLALTLLSERDGTARLDAFADAVAVSFVTPYRFER